MLLGSVGFVALPARRVVVDVRRHVRAVDGRDAARRRRGPQRGPAAGRGRRGTARLPALPGGHAAPGANRRHRAASCAGARAPRPCAAWPAVLAAGRLWSAGARIPTSACCARAPVRSGWPRRWSPLRRARWRDSSRSRRSPCAASCVRTRSSPTCRSRCRCVAPVRSGSRPHRAPDLSPPAHWPAPSWRSTCCGTARPTRSWPWWHRRTWRRSGSG